MRTWGDLTLLAPVFWKHQQASTQPQWNPGLALSPATAAQNLDGYYSPLQKKYFNPF